MKAGKSMTEKARKRNSELTRRKIMAVAESEFSQKGFYGTRIDEIAEVADVNKRMLYEYYGKKDDLYRAVFVHVYSRLAKEEMHLLRGETSCVNAIRKMVRFYFRYLSENQSYINLLLQENLNKGEYVRDVDFSTSRNTSLKRLRALIEQGKKEGVFRAGVDTEQAVVSLLMFTFAYFSNRYTLSNLLKIDFFDQDVLESQMEHVTEMFLRFLCTPKAMGEMYPAI